MATTFYVVLRQVIFAGAGSAGTRTVPLKQPKKPKHPIFPTCKHVWFQVCKCSILVSRLVVYYLMFWSTIKCRKSNRKAIFTVKYTRYYWEEKSWNMDFVGCKLCITILHHCCLKQTFCHIWQALSYTLPVLSAVEMELSFL